MVERNKISLFEEYPEMEKYWCWDKNNDIGVSPYKVTSGSHKKVYLICHKCKEPHYREIRQYIRAKGVCLVCSDNIIKHGVNDFLTKYPELKEYYDFRKNSIDYTQLGISSHEKVIWKCVECDRPFEQSIHARINSTGLCPVSNGHGVITGVNDFFTLRPDLEFFLGL